MIRGRDNHSQPQRRICNAPNNVDSLPELRLPGFASAESSTEDARMVDNSTPNGEGVCKVETREGSKLVEELAARPDALGIVVADGIVEAILFVKESRWHARKESEYRKR